MLSRFLSLLWYFSFFVVPAWSAFPQQTFYPASIPLVVRSPYLSAWEISTVTSKGISHSWPVFWDQNSIVGWVGRIRVDQTTYQWMGEDIKPPFIGNISDIRITPTRSIFTMQAGPMNVTVTFLSPIEPSDWVLQSLPFSYVFIEASAIDGQAHDVQVYTDITAEWLSGNRQSRVMWTQQTSRRSVYHDIELQNPEKDVESANQQAQDGSLYYAMANRPGLTWQIGNGVSFGQFDTHGTLKNTSSAAFGPTQNFMTFTFAVDLGQTQSIQEPVVWAIGLVRDPSIAYTSQNFAVQQLSPYFVTKYGFSKIGAAIDDFTTGFNDTLARAIAFDDALIADATAISPHYADLVSLAIRQTMSTLDITVSKGSDGKPNASDVRIFMKDIGSGAKTARISPVERMYAALPALLYVNASLLGPILSPLLDAQDSPRATAYAAQDLGLAYPRATGTRGPHDQGVEQSGNMLIMLYAHARFSGDGSLIQKHYALAKRWADYLINNTLTPVNQLSADNEGTANMTNLAIKGIIGVGAMAEISYALGKMSDAERYNSSARDLAGQWQALALSTEGQHLLGTYGDEASWALMYNLYADRLLGTNLVSQAVLQAQTAFYKTLLSTAPAFGLARSSISSDTNTAWLLLTAATAQDDAVRDGLVDKAWTRASSNATIGAFADRYDVHTGAILGGSAGPAVGGTFSFLALNLSARDISIPPANSPGSGSIGGLTTATPRNSHSRNRVGVIAGGVAGGVAGAAVVAMGVLCFLRRRYRDSPPAEKVATPGLSRPPTLPRYTDSPYGTLPRYTDSSYGTRSTLNDISSTRNTTLQANSSSTSSSGRLRKTQELVRSALAYAASPPTRNPVTVTADKGPGRARELGLLPPEVSLRSQMDLHDSLERSAPTMTDVFDLRAEVEILQRVMQGKREERLEPPPEYAR